MATYPDKLKIRLWGHVVLAVVWLFMATLALVNTMWIGGAVAALLFMISAWVIKDTAAKLAELQGKR
jgi:hypothetical protein